MAAHRFIVSSVFLFSVFFSLSLSLSCHKKLPNRVLNGISTWKLCVVSMYGAKLRFKIKNLFAPGNSASGWLTIGFPQANKADHIPFFRLKEMTSNSVSLEVCLSIFDLYQSWGKISGNWLMQYTEFDILQYPFAWLVFRDHVLMGKF